MNVPWKLARYFRVFAPNPRGLEKLSSVFPGSSHGRQLFSSYFPPILPLLVIVLPLCAHGHGFAEFLVIFRSFRVQISTETPLIDLDYEPHNFQVKLNNSVFRFLFRCNLGIRLSQNST